MENKTWLSFFLDEIKKKEIKELVHKVSLDYTKDIIYPKKENLLNAFKLTPYNNVKCVIVGQDPYHEENQAMGLSFSVNKDVSIPKSLVNIFKEYNTDLSYKIPNNGDLTSWAKNGVLLINSVLTVKKGKAFSCNYNEYEILFNDVISYLNKKKTPIVFILWGESAKKCIKYIDTSFHLVITSPHPSPLSCYRGFFGSKPFSKTNKFLITTNQDPIDWKLEDIDFEDKLF